MQNQENLKIIEKLTLLGNRVLIQLHEQKELTTSKEGILIPLSDITVSESGKLKTTPSTKTYLSKGTILLTSPTSSLKAGDTVYVAEQAITPQYQFFINRNQLVNQFEGVISIPETLIEAIYND